jgi:hypothetical protein
MNKIIIAWPIMALLAVMVPNLAQAHTQDYNDGYSQGQANAANGISIDTGYLNSHSKDWRTGYNDGWAAARGTVGIPASGNTQQSESSAINTAGNNNHETQAYNLGYSDGMS